jgi:hypothetical protein
MRDMGWHIVDWIMEPGSVVGFFDSVEEMQRVYDQYAGAEEVVVNDGVWNLRK